MKGWHVDVSSQNEGLSDTNKLLSPLIVKYYLNDSTSYYLKIMLECHVAVITKLLANKL